MEDNDKENKQENQHTANDAIEFKNKESLKKSYRYPEADPATRPLSASTSQPKQDSNQTSD